MYACTLLTEANCQPGMGEKTPLYSIIFMQKFRILFTCIISAYGHEVLSICHVMDNIMKFTLKIVLPELFEESYQPVSAQFSSISNIFL